MKTLLLILCIFLSSCSSKIQDLTRTGQTTLQTAFSEDVSCELRLYSLSPLCPSTFEGVFLQRIGGSPIEPTSVIFYQETNETFTDANQRILFDMMLVSIYLNDLNSDCLILELAQAQVSLLYLMQTPDVL